MLQTKNIALLENLLLVKGATLKTVQARLRAIIFSRLLKIAINIPAASDAELHLVTEGTWSRMPTFSFITSDALLLLQLLSENYFLHTGCKRSSQQSYDSDCSTFEVN